MCTLSWWFSGETRGVLFNRDEKRIRSDGLPPEIRHSSDGRMKILMPSDPDGGGTWIGVNESGLIVALLNNYPFHQDGIDMPISRGLLVSELLETARSIEESVRVLDRTNLSAYKGFLIFFMDAKGYPEAFEWDGKVLASLHLRSAGSPRCLTSSSHMAEACKRFRNDLFAKIPHERNDLFDAHTFHHKDNPAYGPLMVRPDARTQSITEIRIAPPQAIMCFTNVTGDPPKPGESRQYKLELTG